MSAPALNWPQEVTNGRLRRRQFKAFILYQWACVFCLACAGQLVSGRLAGWPAAN